MTVRVRTLKQQIQRVPLVELLDRSEQNRKGKAPKGLAPPPYPLERLTGLWELSSSLRQNIDAYATNIDGQGHRFEPAIDLSGRDALARLREALYVQRLYQANGSGGVGIPLPTDEEVVGARSQLERSARIELSRLRQFFLSCAPGSTFLALRQQTRQELEITGNAYWEVLRAPTGQVRALALVPSMTMRISSGDPDEVEVEVSQRVGDLVWAKIQQKREFYRYAQIDTETNRVLAWFRQLGDPRVVSRTTGTAYPTVEDMRAKEPEAKPATDVLHFAIFSPNSRYGAPRWIGNLPGVLGSRELDEVNHAYFQHNSVPPLAVLVAGGRFGKDVHRRFEEFFENDVKGRGSVHRVVILEAEAQTQKGMSGPSVTPQIKMVPLRDVQLSDGLFQEYDQRNIDKLAASFRLPPALFGKGAGSRAVALAALRFAEEQVFGPEREAFDAIMDREILPLTGASFWSFRSRAPVTRDPEILGKLVGEFVRQGVLTLAEAREFVPQVFGRDLPQIREAWAMRPLPITLALYGVKGSPAEAVREQNQPGGEGVDADFDDYFDQLEAGGEEAALGQIGPKAKPPKVKPTAPMDEMVGPTLRGGTEPDEKLST